MTVINERSTGFFVTTGNGNLEAFATKKGEIQGFKD